VEFGLAAITALMITNAARALLFMPYVSFLAKMKDAK